MENDKLNDTESSQITTEERKRSFISEGKTTRDTDELTIEQNFCPIVFLIFCFLFPFGFIIEIFLTYKRRLEINSYKQKLTLYNKNIYGCKRNQQIYNFSDISKLRLFVNSTHDPRIRLDIYLNNNNKIILFSNVKYDEKTYHEYEADLKKHLEIEVEPFKASN